MNDSARPIFAVDIPSGLNADTGQPCGICIRATATATFGLAKIGHLVYPGVEYCGPVDVIDIGIPKSITTSVAPKQSVAIATRVAAMIPQRSPESHKGHNGHLLVLAGATGKTGAAVMTATAAMRVGAGLVTVGAPQTLNPILEQQLIEAMTLPLPDENQGTLTLEAWEAVKEASQGKRCIALGPGIGTAASTRALVQRIVQESPLPLVIDADGLNNLADDLDLLKARNAPTILTPHPGEASRLLGMPVADIQKDRIAAVRTLAERSRACAILKGARTVIGDPDGQVWINTTGNPGMACGGMGDVLTGAVAGLLAQGANPMEAAVAAVHLHGLAADLLAEGAPRGYLATEVMDSLPAAMRQVLIAPPEPTIRGPLL